VGIQHCKYEGGIAGNVEKCIFPRNWKRVDRVTFVVTEFDILGDIAKLIGGSTQGLGLDGITGGVGSVKYEMDNFTYAPIKD
jgi:hypothetical protein